MKTRKQIVRRAKTIETNIVKWDKKLEELQTICTHPAVDKRHNSNIGNYDPSADCYWTEYKCLDCGKFWTENQ